VDPHYLAVDAAHNIFVTDFSAGTGGLGALFTFDPVTGNRIMVSDFGNVAQGTIGADPAGVVVP